MESPKVARRIQGSEGSAAYPGESEGSAAYPGDSEGRATYPGYFCIASLIQIKEWLKSVHFVSRHPALDTPRYLRERPGYAALPSAFPKVEPRIQGAWPTAHWAAHVNDERLID